MMTCMSEALIGSASEHLLLTSDVEQGAPESLEVTLQFDGLTATASVYGYQFQDLADYFAELENAWRGWDGTREWRSLEGDMTIAARHDRHVLLSVELVRSGLHGADAWRVGAHLTIDPGEQLSQIARDVAILVRDE